MRRIDSDGDVVRYLLEMWRPTHDVVGEVLTERGWDGHGNFCCTATRLLLVEQALMDGLQWPGYDTLNQFQKTVALLDMVRRGLDAMVSESAADAIDRILGDADEPEDHA